MTNNEVPHIVVKGPQRQTVGRTDIASAVVSPLGEAVLIVFRAINDIRVGLDEEVGGLVEPSLKFIHIDMYPIAKTSRGKGPGDGNEGKIDIVALDLHREEVRVSLTYVPNLVGI